MDDEWYTILIVVGGVCATLSWCYLRFVDAGYRAGNVLIGLCCLAAYVATVYLETVWPVPHQVKYLRQFLLTVVASVAAFEARAWWEKRRSRTIS